jgi:hypothetical protein
MKTTFLILVAVCLAQSCKAQTASYQWAQHFGKDTSFLGLTTDIIATDKDGNIYLSGNYSGKSYSFGSISVVKDSAFNLNGFIAKLSSSGTPIWVRGMKNIISDDQSFTNQNKIAVDATGNIYFCGVYMAGAQIDSVTIPGGATDNFFIAKLNSTGTVAWVKGCNSSTKAHASKIALHIDQKQNINVVGIFDNAITFDSANTLTNTYFATNTFLAHLDTNGNYISASALGPILFAMFNSNQHELFQFDVEDNLYRLSEPEHVLIKYNSNGVQIDRDTITPTAGNLDIMSLAVDYDKNILLAGFFTSPYLVFGADSIQGGSAYNPMRGIVLQFDSNNNIVWNYSNSPNTISHYYTRIYTDDIGNVYMLSNDYLFFREIGITKLSKSGTLIWKNSIYLTNQILICPWGTTGYAALYGYGYQRNNLAITNNGNLLVMGTFTDGGVGFDVTLTPSLGLSIGPYRTDVYLAKIGNCNLAPSLLTSSVNSLCANDSATLTTASSAKYLWSTTDTLNPISITAAGSYYVYTIDSSGCYAKSNDIDIIAYPAPDTTIAKSNSTTFCSGDSVILTAAPSNTYLWNTGDTTQSITVKTIGYYSAIVTNLQGCSQQTELVSVSISPSINANIINNGQNLTASPTGQYNYQWIDCNNYQIIPNATNEMYIPISAGSYAVIVTNLNGCIDTSSCASFIPTNINELDTTELISLNPNPMNNYLHINVATYTEFTIINSMGQNVLKTNFIGGQHKLNIENLPSGIYFAKARIKGQSIITKLCKN